MLSVSSHAWRIGTAIEIFSGWRHSFVRYEFNLFVFFAGLNRLECIIELASPYRKGKVFLSVCNCILPWSTQHVKSKYTYRVSVRCCCAIFEIRSSRVVASTRGRLFMRCDFHNAVVFVDSVKSICSLSIKMTHQLMDVLVKHLSQFNFVISLSSPSLMRLMEIAKSWLLFSIAFALKKKISDREERFEILSSTLGIKFPRALCCYTHRTLSQMQ